MQRRGLALVGFAVCAAIGVTAALLTRDVVGLTAGFTLGIAFVIGVWFFESRSSR